ncbi:MAG: glutathione S-transferase family protein [Rhodospirillaceae bacterium]|jgi:glutathione S-transferase|nr:glutathione S-transferase family protein [Rhodospirillaceae bacterium]MBT6510599.1 glutathione S-transferase family protein [Rhodospirillaceae bacterium]
MIKLFNSPTSTSMSAHAALEEIGCDYESRWVDISIPLEQRDPEFQALTPHGAVPVLVDDDGTVVFEGTAVLLYLADRFPSAQLGPAVGDPKRGDFLKWLAYMTNTHQIAMQIYFMPDRFTTSASGHDDITAKGIERLDESWRLIDATCAAPGPYLLGETFSVCDLHLQMLTLWHRDSAAMRARYPHVKRCAELVEQRPAVQRIMKDHGPDWDAHYPDFPGPP